LEHPAIVPIYDFGQHGKQPYIVMRHMPNGTLFDRIIAGNLTPADLYHVIERVASALDEAHGQGIVHRDVKLSNILFDNAHHACLADFGLAKFAQRTTGVTGTLFIGSPEYMSPEQVRRERVDGRTDIYALGVVLFLALTNQFPYKGRSPAKTAMAHLTAPIPSVRTAKPDLPDMWDEIISLALAKDPADRYATAGELARDVDLAINKQWHLRKLLV
jgi:serine/threonine protein kinase